MYNCNKCFKNKSANYKKPNSRDQYARGGYDAKGERESSEKIRRAIAVINPSYFFITPTTYTYSMIIDPMFPARETCLADSANTILEDDLVFLAKSVIKNGLYKDVPMMKCCIYTLYQLEIIMMSLVLNLKSSMTCYPSAFHRYFYLI